MVIISPCKRCGKLTGYDLCGSCWQIKQNEKKQNVRRVNRSND